MTCRDEFPTRHNRASFLRTQRTLSNISDVWVQYRIHRACRLQFIKTKRKVRVWKRDMRGFRRGCRELLLKYKDNPRVVTADDWDTMTAGKEKKLYITYGKRYSAEKWPKVVPYLNLIAYAEYCAARKAARAAQKARTEARLKKKAAAAARKAETTAKHAKVAENARSTIDDIPWRDPIAMEAILKALEHKNKHIEGTDALKIDRTIACYVELARRREMGEPCDGWVFGRYFGP
jgi:rubrerythrin